MTRDDVVTEARNWLGTPWRHQGRSAQGVDCVGLGVAVAQALGVSHEDMPTYARQPANTAMLDHIRKFTKRIPLDAPNKIGTIGLFRSSIYPCHTGFFSTKNGIAHVIHARADMRKVVEEPFIDGKNGLILVEVRAFPELEIS